MDDLELFQHLPRETENIGQISVTTLISMTKNGTKILQITSLKPYCYNKLVCCW